MNDKNAAGDGRDEDQDREHDHSHDGNTIAPLPGELGIPNVAQRSRSPMSKKGLLAVGLLILSLVAATHDGIATLRRSFIVVCDEV